MPPMPSGAVAMTGVVVLALRGFDDDAIRRQQKDRDFRRVLQGGALDFRRRDDAGLDDVHVFAGEGVEAFIVFAIP